MLDDFFAILLLSVLRSRWKAEEFSFYLAAEISNTFLFWTILVLNVLKGTVFQSVFIKPINKLLKY